MSSGSYYVRADGDPYHPCMSYPQVHLFISYAHRDQGFRNALEKHLASLKRAGHIATWHDRQILAGDHIEDTIDRNLEVADLVLLLVSADFLASDYCDGVEVRRAMQRWEAGEARVVPVILRPCDWHDTTFGKLLAVPCDGKPVSTWRNRDAAFLDVVQAIKSIRSALHASSRMLPDRSLSHPRRIR